MTIALHFKDTAGEKIAEMDVLAANSEPGGIESVQPEATVIGPLSLV